MGTRRKAKAEEDRGEGDDGEEISQIMGWYAKEEIAYDLGRSLLGIEEFLEIEQHLDYHDGNER
jgi:hypothetical protein